MTAIGRIAENITSQLPAKERIVMDEATVGLILTSVEDVDHTQLSYERKARIIKEAVKKADAEGGSTKRLFLIAIFAVYRFDLKPADLTYLVSRTGKADSFRICCTHRAKQRERRRA